MTGSLITSSCPHVEVSLYKNERLKSCKALWMGAGEEKVHTVFTEVKVQILV